MRILPEVDAAASSVDVIHAVPTWYASMQVHERVQLAEAGFGDASACGYSDFSSRSAAFGTYATGAAKAAGRSTQGMSTEGIAIMKATRCKKKKKEEPAPKKKDLSHIKMCAVCQAHGIVKKQYGYRVIDEECEECGGEGVVPVMQMAISAEVSIERLTRRIAECDSLDKLEQLGEQLRALQP